MYAAQMADVTLITPLVMTHDLESSLRFFTNTLGFECNFKMENYAFINRKRCAIRLLEIDKSCEICEQMIYLDCDDVDALYAELKLRLDDLPDGRVRAPFNQPYQQREFHVKDPDNCLLFFGMDIRAFS